LFKVCASKKLCIILIVTCLTFLIFRHCVCGSGWGNRLKHCAAILCKSWKLFRASSCGNSGASTRVFFKTDCFANQKPKFWGRGRFEMAQVEARFGFIERAHAAFVSSVYACPPNLCWKVSSWVFVCVCLCLCFGVFFF
jgi:hypothetical protein